MVIGAGVAGITAALDLADKGFTIYLVEKSTSIGGYMAQLDKTFPTLDCSICILAPKMVEVSRHPNIKLFTCSEVEEVKRSKDGASFKVKVVKKPRYVDETKCTGCRTCVEKCPIKVPSEFEVGLGDRKAIYIPFPQAVPAIAAIDENVCLYFKKGVCRVCEKVCPAKAINFNQEEENILIEVSSIIVAIGHDLLDPSTLHQYKYDNFSDVLSSLQYERIMNAAGPTCGKIVKLSNNTKPDNIVFIQCVGSRSQKKKEKPYCSQVCCTYATKQAIVTKEHEPEVDVNILYNDLKVDGKGYEGLIKRAKEEFKVNYIKGLPGEVQRDQLTGKLIIRYMDAHSSEIKYIHADLVILCPAITPTNDSKKLGEKLGIEVDEYGFFKSSDPLLNVKTKVPGIFICGSSQGPKDISLSVIHAHAAAAEALLRGALHKLSIKTMKEKKTKVITEAKPRIGVFICHCGLNIAEVVDVKNLTEYASTLSAVAYAEDLMFACSKDGTERIKEVIKDKKLNRVVVAACTPRTHASLFRSICKEVQLNPYLFEMINIREHDSWVHRLSPEEATDKAKVLVRMAVAKAALLEPLEELITNIKPNALIIGGSIAGLMSAKVIADAGFKVHLVEESDELGGRVLNDYPNVPFKEVDMKPILTKLIKTIKDHDNIEVLLSSKPTEFKGSIGNFEATISSSKGETTKKSLKIGVTIIATEAVEQSPVGIYGYGNLESVYTISEFRKIVDGHKIRKRETIGYILYDDSQHCLEKALDSALKLKKMYPASKIYMFHEDIKLPLLGEKSYKDAREFGIAFIRYSKPSKPKIFMEGKTKVVEAHDLTLNEWFHFPIDRIILSVPLVAPEKNEEFSSIFKIPLNKEGFFLEAHPKMRPLDFSSDGLFMCGTAHSPISLDEAATQGLAAASRALLPLILKKLPVEPLIAKVDEDKCVGCGTCVSICEYNAPKMTQSTHGRIVTQIDSILCKGCGTCPTHCPSRAIEIKGFKSSQIMAMIRAALIKPTNKLRAIAFLCNWCAYAGADTAGVSRFQYPPSINIIRIMCSGMVDPFYVLYAFMQGADGVVVGGCRKGDCHYTFGNVEAEKTLNTLRETLETTLIEPERLLALWISAGEGRIFADKITEYTEKLKSLGPSPFKRS